MKPQCYLASLYVEYLGLIALAVFIGVRGQLGAAALVLGLGVVGVWAYVKVFPRISRFVGYGSLVDRPADAPGAVAATVVTLYTATGCPFCPIVRHRLQALQADRGFVLRQVDVTVRPDILMAKGIRAVPVVEVGDRQLIGHATTKQLAALIGGRPVSFAA
jgi:glutaredoxin